MAPQTLIALLSGSITLLPEMMWLAFAIKLGVSYISQNKTYAPLFTHLIVTNCTHTILLVVGWSARHTRANSESEWRGDWWKKMHTLHNARIVQAMRLPSMYATNVTYSMTYTCVLHRHTCAIQACQTKRMMMTVELHRHLLIGCFNFVAMRAVICSRLLLWGLETLESCCLRVQQSCCQRTAWTTESTIDLRGSILWEFQKGNLNERSFLD